jgi:hypothetical protein
VLLRVDWVLAALKRLRAFQRVAAVFIVGAVVGSMAAVVTHRIVAPSNSEPIEEYRQDRAPLAGTGFSAGMALRDLALTSADGERQTLMAIVAGSEETVVHFIDRNCVSCMSDLRNWGAAAAAGTVPVLFVACNEPEPVYHLDGLDSRTRLYSLVRQGDRSRGPRVVPLTIVVDQKATVIGSVRGLGDFVRRWHAHEDTP